MQTVLQEGKGVQRQGLGHAPPEGSRREDADGREGRDQSRQHPPQHPGQREDEPCQARQQRPVRLRPQSAHQGDGRPGLNADQGQERGAGRRTGRKSGRCDQENERMSRGFLQTTEEEVIIVLTRAKVLEVMKNFFKYAKFD